MSESVPGAGNGAFVVGDSALNAGGSDYLYLGYQNTISAGTILTGRENVPSAVMQFNPIYFYNGFGPSATFTGYPSGAVAVWSIGDGVVSGGVNSTGTNDFSLGAVNATVNTLYVGRAAASGSGAGVATGTLTLGTGSFNVNALYIGYQPTAGGNSAVGTVNVTYTPLAQTGQSSGTLSVNQYLYLGYAKAGPGAANTTGTLTITNGGTVKANSILTGPLGASTINIGSPFTVFGGPPAGGTLFLGNQAGTPTAPITALNLFEGATIHLNLNGSVSPPANVVAKAVNAYDPAVVVINSVANLPPGGATFHLIAYQGGADPYGSLFLGSLPSGYYATLVNNAANSTIDLRVSQGSRAPAISQQPGGQSVCLGGIATFSVEASGTGPLTFQWQYSPTGPSGSLWYGLTAAKGFGPFTPVLSFPAEASQNGYAYRVKVSNSVGPIYSSPATLTVSSAPVVIPNGNPANQTVNDGQTVMFSAAASVPLGTPEPAVQWRSSTDYINWSDVPGVPVTAVNNTFDGETVGSTLTINTALYSQNANHYEAVFTDPCGNVTTSPATLTVNCMPAPAINVSEDEICGGSGGHAATGEPSAGGAFANGSTFSWDIKNGLITSPQPYGQTVAYTAGLPGTGPVTLSLIVTSPDGCSTAMGKEDVAIYPSPTTETAYLETSQGTSVEVPLTKLLANAQTGMPGGTLSITAVNYDNPNNYDPPGSVALTPTGFLTYTPPSGVPVSPANSSADSFTYTVSDGCSSAQGTVSVTIISSAFPPRNQIAITMNAGCANLFFAGIPNQSYNIQWNVPGNNIWTRFSGGPFPADAHGLITYSDCRGLPTVFYRTQSAP